MHAIQTRCLKCGTVFASTAGRVLHCSCCYADENYLKAVITDTVLGEPGTSAHLAECAVPLDAAQVA